MSNKLNLSLKAVIFDLDGTLYPIRQVARNSWLLMCQHPRLFSAFGRARRTLRGEKPGVDLRHRQAEIVAKLLGIKTAVAANAVEKIIYQQWPSTFRRLRPYYYVPETLTHLRGNGLRLGIISDSPFARQKLRALGLNDGWNLVVTADEVGMLKPNPEPFLRVVDDFQIQPKEILFIGNSYSKDIMGAHQVGMRTAHRTRRKVAAGIAEFSFSNYSSFLKFFSS